MDINSAVGRKAGLTDEKIRAVSGNQLDPFNETELLVIELADALAETPANVSDDLYARLQNRSGNVKIPTAETRKRVRQRKIELIRDLRGIADSEDRPTVLQEFLQRR